MTIYDPLPSLTPTLLVQYHDQFRRGYLRNAALMWDRIEELDDKAQAVIPKRRKAASRHGYEFIMAEGEEKNPRAQKHLEALKYAYEHLSVTSAIDRNYRGGVPLLLRQMLDAIGKRYSVHEIVWKPSAAGITAELRHVPLWFFENTSGKLRYLPSDAALYGEDLEPGGWMTTVADGLMYATSVCYLYKRLPLRDWIVYSQRLGGLHGKTDATKGSDAWNELEDALANVGLDLSILTDRNCDITALDVSVSGNLPWPPLVEAMNRAISTLWRGGDLSTMSASGPDSVGASVQGEESDILEQDDAEILTETLNEQFDRWVIRYTLDEEPLAWVKVKTSQRQDVGQDLQIDQALSSLGWTHTVEALAARYGRSVPQAGETPLTPRPTAPAIPPATALLNEEPDPAEAARRALVSAAVAETEEARRAILEDWFRRFEELDQDSMSETEALLKMEALVREMPAELLTPANVERLAKIHEGALGAAVVNALEGIAK